MGDIAGKDAVIIFFGQMECEYFHAVDDEGLLEVISIDVDTLYEEGDIDWFEYFVGAFVVGIKHCYDVH